MTKRTYRRTEDGRKAWDTQDSRVPLECRRVLGLVGFDTDPAALRAKLGGYSEAELHEMLDELEQRGLVKSIESGPDRTDLDFTGNFNLADLQAPHEDLDFTSGFNIADLKAAAKQ